MSETWHQRKEEKERLEEVSTEVSCEQVRDRKPAFGPQEDRKREREKLRNVRQE